MSREAHRITRDDILSMEDFARIRDARRAEIIAVKARRRVPVGPDITFYFENYDTMWWQVHEMLRSEKGGEAQIDDELAAYNPLIPKGDELVATMMIEIDNPERRARALAGLGGIERAVAFRIDDQTIPAEPEHDVERTTSEGRTSSVHFLHFRFTAAQIEAFRSGKVPVILEISHPGYAHMAVLPDEVRAELAGDFDPPVAS